MLPTVDVVDTDRQPNMFIMVKYGNNETLLCNPSCAVINLLTSIKRRTGYDNANLIVDLSDETGLIKELDMHKHEYASKFLASHGTYILVRKEVALDPDAHDDPPGPPHFTYTPLLEKWAELFPEYRIHVQEVERKSKRIGSKSPSPAGRLHSKTKKNAAKSSKRK